MGDLGAAWIVLGVLVLMLGPTGAAWVGCKVAMNGLRERLNTFMAAAEKERDETRDWLRSLERRTSRHETDIAVLKTKHGPEEEDQE